MNKRDKILFIVAVFIIAITISGGYYLARNQNEITYKGRLYGVGNNPPLTKSEIEHKYKVDISFAETSRAGEIWVSNNKPSDCVQPCTDTVIFLKQNNDKFKEYALSGGP